MGSAEVLAAGRKALRNPDVAEAEFWKQAGKDAYQIGGVVCCLICWLRRAYTKAANLRSCSISDKKPEKTVIFSGFAV